MKQCDLVVRTIVGVQTAFTQDDRRKLLESRDLGYSIDAYNIGNVNANIYLLFASIVAGDPDFTPAVVRFYELRASSAKLLLDTGNKFASAVVIGITDLTADGRSSSEEVIPPGDLIGLLPEGRLTESQVTSLLEGLQRVSMSDDLDYRKDRKRERKVVRDVKGLLAEQGLDDGSGTEEGASAVDNGEVNSAVYYPSEQFQQKWANEVMRAAGGHGFSRRLLDESGRVTVTAVVFYRSTTADGGSVAFASVAYTVRLAEGRCFLCDRRDVFSSETDSEKHSELKSTSVASSSQTNFRDSARYNCPRDRTFRYGGYAYQVALFQGLFTQGCSTCGNFVPTCANHASASEAYASEQAVLATFTGSEKVEKSKHLGGKKLVDPYDVPNKKVFYEENGAPASSEQFDTKTVRVGDTVIKIPTKGR